MNKAQKPAQTGSQAGEARHPFPPFTSETALQDEVRECGYHCRGEMLPTHVCRFADPDPHAAHAKH